MLIVPLSEQKLEGYGLINDAYNQPNLIARIEQPRTLYQQVQRSLQNLALAFAFGGVVLCVILVLVIDRLVVRRVLQLGSDVQMIGSHGLLSARVPVQGNDELSHLGAAINQMLSEIELAHAERQAAEHEQFVALEHINMQLQENLVERLRVERIKSEFISVVSHELRTPLTSIRGSLGLVNGGVTGELPAQARALLHIAQTNSERLVRLINDILDVEKIEAGKMVLDLRRVALRPLLEQAIAENTQYAAHYEVTFGFESQCNAEATVDRDRLLQVMSNLLSNAAKFSPKGERVTVMLETTHASAGISVTDHGPGIETAFASHK